MFFSLQHTKRIAINTRNVIACGCDGPHKATNARCEYTVWNLYIKRVKKCDESLRTEGFKRYNKTKRNKHFLNENQLVEINFMRAINTEKNKYHHRNMELDSIANGLEYWNRKLKLRKEKMVGASGRKTYI